MGREPDTRWVMVTDTAFADLYRTHHGAICRYAARRLGPSDDDRARDVAAEVFTIAWRRRAVIPADPLPWLYGVARRVVANERRGLQRRQRLAQRLRAQPVSAAPLADAAGSPVLVALGHLSPADQEVLALAAWEELGPADIAVVLNCSRSAASMRLHRARHRLRAALAALHEPPPPARSESAPGLTQECTS